MINTYGLKDECKNPNCQHERDSHHKDEEGVWNCLALHCECRRFHNHPPVKQVVRLGADDDEWGTQKPHSDTSCECTPCREWTQRKLKTWSPFGYGVP